ncbi:ABC transporter ATP-binding protein [Deinococcus ruber]|uniref:ABC transporter n=1 Tax=Deinococcus ruber TaxID=1848197 RepID=A0A918FI91_9DEIO|nr:ABC transporter ATP-binding protein [Deinococcus ruber]GGR39517.1 ABC transporter [Deinococcus ruber]
MNAIETHALSKLYGTNLGLHPLDLTVRPGEIFGFLGPNGAGKTTTIRTLMGFLRPTSGTATLMGRDVWREREAVHARVGYLPGDVHLPRDLSARELLERSARLRGSRDVSYGLEVASRLELRLTPQLGTLSKGNRQKVGLVLALMHRPEVLLLDEPTDGLDPLAQETVLEVLRETSAQGRTVFLSSHVLREVERVADRVAILRQGRLVRVDALNVLKASLPQHLEIRFAAPPMVNLTTLPGMSKAHLAGLNFTGLWRGNPEALIRALAAESLIGFSLVPSSLEDAFLEEYRPTAQVPEPSHVA